MKRILFFIITVTITISLTACVKKPTNPIDPYERFNRAMYQAHKVVDNLIYRPIATLYSNVIPNPIRRGVSNFFDNINEVPIVVNDLLQGKIRYALNDLWRFIFNSTLGIGGLFDIASKMGLPKHYEDFGLTLAFYSHDKRAPYLFIPFLGPFTFRHAFGLPFDAITSPLFYSAVINSDFVVYGLIALKYLNIRAKLLSADKLIEAAFDPYAFIRNAYMQRRMQLIRNNDHDLAADFISIPVNGNDGFVEVSGKENKTTKEIPLTRHDITSRSVASRHTLPKHAARSTIANPTINKIKRRVPHHPISARNSTQHRQHHSLVRQQRRSLTPHPTT